MSNSSGNRKMKSVIFISIIVILTSCSANKDKRLTVDEVWTKYIETFGDYETVRNVRTYSNTDIVKTKFGEIKSIAKLKYPDKVYSEIEYPNNEKVIYIMNGDAGIIKSPKGVEFMNKGDIERFSQMSLIFPETYFKQLGYNMVLKNDTVVDGNKLYNIEITTNIEKVNYLIKKDGFVMFQIVSDGFITEVLETEIVDGVRLIKSSKNIIGEDIMISNNIKYELNGKIDDSIFELE
ncbi:MAG: hypothetical protein N4A72_20955 [Bacteroidales bacterium]|jgi:hypothetical protein|nr:hypothetical protein [Bacteroidales bacterium]